MAWTSYLWWIIIIIIVIIISWVAIKKGKKKHLICQHNFNPVGYIIVKEKPRLVMICKKCLQAVHIPIPSKRKLNEMEDAFYDRYFSRKSSRRER